MGEWSDRQSGAARPSHRSTHIWTRLASRRPRFEHLNPMRRYTLRVNGRQYTTEESPDTPLLWVLRDSLRLNGTKYGCGIGVCGACTIHLGGQATRSCMVPISSVGEVEVTTIEGLSAGGTHPVQRAWVEERVSQCGYCQAGQIMSAVALLEAHPAPTDEQIDAAMRANLCRCGTYARIRRAVHRASSLGTDD